MAKDCRAVSIRCVPTQGQARREAGTVVFNGTVLRAEASIIGVSIDNGAQHVLREMVTLDIDRIDHNVVTVGCNFLTRHDSGSIDDSFGGRVDVLVVADVVHPVFRSARGDASSWE